MPPKKGISAQEKRNRILNYMSSKKEPFKKDEVIKFAKNLGINNRDVAESVLNELVGDNLVCKEQIGSGNFYWSFPSELQKAIVSEINQSEIKIEKFTQLQEQCVKEIELAKEGREESEQRTQLMEELRVLKSQYKDQQTKINKLAESSPDYLEQLQKEKTTVKLNANHWSDQLYQVQKYLISQLKQPSQSVEQLFQAITEDPEFSLEKLEELS